MRRRWNMGGQEGNNTNVREGQAVQDPRDVIDVSWVVGFLFLFAFDYFYY